MGIEEKQRVTNAGNPIYDSLITSRERQVLLMMDQEDQLSQQLVDNMADHDLLNSLSLKGLICETGPCNSCDSLKEEVLYDMNSPTGSPLDEIDMSDELHCVKDIMLKGLKKMACSSPKQLVADISAAVSMDNLILLFPAWENQITCCNEAAEIETWIGRITNQFFPQ